MLFESMCYSNVIIIDEQLLFESYVLFESKCYLKVSFNKVKVLSKSKCYQGVLFES